MQKNLLASLVSAFLSFGCSAGGTSHALIVGSEGTGGSSVGPAGIGGGSFMVSGDASASNALSAHIESPPPVTVTFITLSCSEACADVVAVAKGGFAPYSFTWEDGAQGANRHVCPTDSTRYEVTVKDKGSTSGEFPRPAQTVKVPLTATVLRCPRDGGTPPPPPVDSGAPHAADPCFSNPSFEGNAATNLLGCCFDAAPWTSCSGTPDIWNENQSWAPGSPPPKASNGSSYLELYVGPPTLVALETVSEPLCRPLESGTTYSMKMDLSFQVSGAYGGSSAGILELWGGSAVCAEDQLLWTSPVVTPTWQTHCLTFTADRPLSHVKLKPKFDGASTTGVFVDNLVPVANCN